MNLVRKEQGMLAVTESAIDAIKRVAPGNAGLRLFTSDPPGAGAGRGLQVQVTVRPGPMDHVLDAEGARVYLDPGASALLDDKLLDAAVEGVSVRFVVSPQG
jgi:iron-sulfur cluster assembly protein